MSERKPYPSDLSDEPWLLIEPMITAWKDRHRSVSGHQGAYAMREIVNAILYQGRTGCQWAYLPHDLPPKSATYYYFAAWRDDGTDQVIHELLRCQVRECARRLEDPTLVVLDTQSVHAAAGSPPLDGYIRTLNAQAMATDTAGERWLLPGRFPSQHLSRSQLVRRLRPLGVRPCMARNTALVELASELPAVVVSRLLGVHQNTADAWKRIGGQDNAYAAEVASRP
ncbi:transposase [Streptomyces sp. NBC_00268]|nr:transposase [Streptomyces sp. NBC_00268]